MASVKKLSAKEASNDLAAMNAYADLKHGKPLGLAALVGAANSPHYFKRGLDRGIGAALPRKMSHNLIADIVVNISAVFFDYARLQFKICI